ncbi:hypothetical protein E2542_SST28884 [Spatholobus suberectus]|nr:hypothetical protein E2542_SST28884 [Spatholobus suberectus]
MVAAGERMWWSLADYGESLSHWINLMVRIWVTESYRNSFLFPPDFQFIRWCEIKATIMILLEKLHALEHNFAGPPAHSLPFSFATSSDLCLLHSVTTPADYCSPYSVAAPPDYRLLYSLLPLRLTRPVPHTHTHSDFGSATIREGLCSATLRKGLPNATLTNLISLFDICYLPGALTGERSHKIGLARLVGCTSGPRILEAQFFFYFRRRLSRRTSTAAFASLPTGDSTGSEFETMGTEFETIEARITSMLAQLQSECGILQRMVYKNKNQHRRCSYFQRLLKVRRDLRLLQSANLEELVTSCFLVIKGDRPKQKVHLLESLKRRKCDGEKHNFMERLIGAARLLAEMVEPILKAAFEVSVLFAQSFFMGFSLTIMALLARLRVLVQQILLDIVSLFNMVSSLSITKQSIKITHNGIEVFRDFYPVSGDFVTLECVWKSDKFILLERKHKTKDESQAEDSGGNVSVQTSDVNYNSIESFLGDDQLVPEGVEADVAAKDPCHINDQNTDLLIGSSQIDNKETIYSEEGENQGTTKSSINESSPEVGLHASSRSSTNDELHSCSKKVAFVSIKNLTLTRRKS